MDESKAMSMKLCARVCVCAAFVFFLVGCTSSGSPVPVNMSKAWGYVDLQPKEGVPNTGKSASQYSDRRYKNAVVLDYTSYEGTFVYEGRDLPQGGRLDVN